MAQPRRIIELRAGDRETLEQWVRSRTTAQRLVERARIVLSSADGHSNSEICELLSIAHPTVTLWLDRFEEGGIEALERDRPRSGRPKRLDPERVEAEIVRRTTKTKPPTDVAMHWSTRLMGAEFGVSQTTVWRIWRACGLKPHLAETFKLSNDPNFVEKLRDVVGLYVSPPERAVVFSVDEKSQI
jgi:transposase